MPTTAHFVKKARKNIYENGFELEYLSMKGKHKGQMLSKTDYTIPANKKDKILIAKGEPYWWWKFKNRDRQVSKEEPSLGQLKKYGMSEWDSNMKEYDDRKDELERSRDMDDQDSLKSDIEEYRDDLQGRLDNMPDQLQESSVLNERIESLNDLLAEIDDIACEDHDDDEENED